MALPTTLAEWLAHCERIHPKEIDLTLERVRPSRHSSGCAFDMRRSSSSPAPTARARPARCSNRSRCSRLPRRALTPSRIWSTSRSAAASAARRSPPTSCCRTSRRSRRRAASVGLTYFEFTLAGHRPAARATALDLVILEVGLGGRFDAVNVFDADCAVITSIDIDHVEFLGPDRESIGREKAGIMRPGRPVVVGDPLPPQSVLDAAERVGADLWRVGRDFNHAGDRQQWSWARPDAALQLPGLSGAARRQPAAQRVGGARRLRSAARAAAGHARRRCAPGWRMVELPGRFQIVAGPADAGAGRRPQPARGRGTGAEPRPDGLLPAHPRGVRRDARQGHRRDPRADGAAGRRTGISPTCRRRARPAADELADSRRGIVGAAGARSSVACHADPSRALAAALAAADPADRIVVFGSFYTVGGVLAARPAATCRPHTLPDTDPRRRRPRRCAVASPRLSRLGPTHGSASIFKREDDALRRQRRAKPADAVRQARTRARRRLIGAVVLLAIGVIGFPLVFETQPRPHPGRHPDRDPARGRGRAAAEPRPGRRSRLAAAPARAAARQAARRRHHRNACRGRPRSAPPHRRRGDAGRPEAAATPGAKPQPESAMRQHRAPAASAADRPTPRGAAPSPCQADAAQAQDAPADGAPSASALEAPAGRDGGGRYVVQVGAFADADAARETRARGREARPEDLHPGRADPGRAAASACASAPSPTRAEADAALAKVKAAGLQRRAC